MGTTEVDVTIDISPQETTEHTAPEPNGSGRPVVRAGSRRGRIGWIAGSLVVIAVLAVVGFFIFQASDADGELPEGFPPRSELPLVDGEITESMNLQGTQSEVTIRVADPAQQSAALTALTAAGYQVIGAAGSGPVGTVTSLSSDTHSVRVAFGQDSSGAFTVTYLTSPRTGANSEE